MYYAGVVLVSVLILSQIYRIALNSSNYVSFSQQSSEKLLLLPFTSTSLRGIAVNLVRYVYLQVVENEDAAISNKVLLLQ